MGRVLAVARLERWDSAREGRDAGGCRRSWDATASGRFLRRRPTFHWCLGGGGGGGAHSHLLLHHRFLVSHALSSLATDASHSLSIRHETFWGYLIVRRQNVFSILNEGGRERERRRRRRRKRRNRCRIGTLLSSDASMRSSFEGSLSFALRMASSDSQDLTASGCGQKECQYGTNEGAELHGGAQGCFQEDSKVGNGFG